MRASEDLPWVARWRLIDSAMAASSGAMEGFKRLERMRRAYRTDCWNCWGVTEEPGLEELEEEGIECGELYSKR